MKSPRTTKSTLSVLRQFNLELVSLVQRVRQSVVTISGYSLDFATQSYGSGWFYDRTGYIVTNHHVIASIARKPEITISGSKAQDAEIIGSDEDTDLAVIRPVNYANKEFMPLPIRPTPAQVGELCLTMGSPLKYNDSVNMGIVSGIARQLVREAGKSEEIIQVDAAINPGNSGGALVDIDGAVLGVVVAKDAQAENINFAIPSEIVGDIVPELIQYGAVMRGTMGIRIGAEWARDGSDRQVITVQSIRSTPSAFVVGDIIVAINGMPIERRYDVRRLLNRHAIGTNLVVDIMRNNSPHTLSVHVTLRVP